MHYTEHNSNDVSTKHRYGLELFDSHLFCNGFLRNCTTWKWHGELLHLPSVIQTQEFVDSSMDDILEDIIRDVGAKSFDETLYKNMLLDDGLHYPSSTNFT